MVRALFSDCAVPFVAAMLLLLLLFRCFTCPFLFSLLSPLLFVFASPAEAGVQEWLCRLISVLASSDDPARAKRVADCGALDIVLAVMSRFGGAPGATVHEGALHGACLALSRLCTHEDVRERFMRASGVELLCATMERVEHNAGLAEMGCR
jgi:hypothetical protein